MIVSAAIYHKLFAVMNSKKKKYTGNFILITTLNYRRKLGERGDINGRLRAF